MPVRRRGRAERYDAYGVHVAKAERAYAHERAGAVASG